MFVYMCTQRIVMTHVGIRRILFVGQPSTHVDWLHLSHPDSVQVRTSVHAGVHVRNNNGSGSKSWKKKTKLGWVGNKPNKHK